MFGAPPAWWGWTVLGLGAASGLLGVVWALAQHDLKRLLAFHSVENIGIILLGVGAGALGLAYARPVMAVLGFAGAALHTLNHALFKSLLFLGAGAMAHAAGTRDIDRLGGLAKLMPATSAAFLIGCAAIVGLPPLNGFVSEWLVMRAALDAGVGGGGARAAVLSGAVLGLIGALALACFAKVVGVIFLGSAREDGAAHAHEAPAGLVNPLFPLAAACLLIGIAPVLVLPTALRVGALVAGAPAAAAALPSASSATGALSAFTLALGALIAAALAYARAAGPRATAAATWGCGYPLPSPRMQYTGSSFAAPLLAPYRAIAGVRTHRTATALATHAGDPVLDQVLAPAWRGMRGAATLLRPMQRSRLSIRLLYLEAVLVALLLYLLMNGGSA
jgi:NADH:ubiquinone oxidoreductase subunit 5 (subunit L)/multisubunit Na+/H+ antiporter MnhA subunit